MGIGASSFMKTRVPAGNDKDNYLLTVCVLRTETATSKFRAVTVHFVWKPYDDEIYTFADFFEQFGRQAIASSG